MSAETEAGAEEPRRGAKEAVRDVLTTLMKPFVFILAELGFNARLLGQAVFWGLRRPFRWRLFASAMEFVGVQSIFIVGLTGWFVGMVFGIQLVDGFRQFGAENQTGSIVGLALARELAPVFTALMVSARAGSAICTEIGSMKVSQQIDALITMAVQPVQYLVTPRLFAGVVMVPVLAFFFFAVGMVGAWFVCVVMLQLDHGIFIDKVRWFVDGKDLIQGFAKALVFGLAITLVACRQGFFASGGAAGVGQATNRAVVQGAVSVLALDYVVTALLVDQGGY